MIKKITGEVWKSLQFPGHKTLRRKYAVSSTGRVASFSESITADGKLLTGSFTSGYKTLNLRMGGGNHTLYIHREIARQFCKRTSSKHKYVIHLNHTKEDNHHKNLKWVTLSEMSAHQQFSPKKIAYKEWQASRLEGRKLNAAKVKAIKEVINNPKRKQTYKQLATKYNVSEMTLFRIKNGKSWGRVK